MALKHRLIEAGFAAFRASGAHRALSGLTRGCGVILALHRVRPFQPELPGYAPNRLLEITPEFLAEALNAVQGAGFELVSLEEAARRLRERVDAPFAALTFDDGYRDNREFALPVLERARAPFTVFMATGFLDRTASLWWLELEQAIARLDVVELARPGFDFRAETRTAGQKALAYERIYWALRARPEAEMLDAIGELARRADVRAPDIAAEAFLGWDEARDFARHPLISIGAHRLTHRRLAHWPPEAVRDEMAASRAALETRLETRVTSFAYPVGDPASAGTREFDIARELGFACAVTTRPGMLFPEHAEHMTALPRVSLNGLWQDPARLEILLTGAPFALWNRGRRLNVA